MRVRIVSPATGTVRVLRKPELECEKYPHGRTGIIRIVSQTRTGEVSHEYAVDLMNGGEIWMSHDDSPTYVIPASLDRCSCGDFVHRGRSCKHILACRALKARGILG